MNKLLLVILLTGFSGLARAQSTYTADSYKTWEKKPWDNEYTKNGRITADTFRLYSVIFVFAKDSFYYDTAADLDSLVAWMTEKPGVRIEVGIHRSRCSLEYGNRLYTRRRAEYVRNYLLKKGIAPERITARGYECSLPLIPEEEREKLRTEDERMHVDRINRRIEIRILDQ